jgi:hypothetical protein
MIHFTKSQGELVFSKYETLNALFTAAQNYAGGCFLRYIQTHNDTKPPEYGKLSLEGNIYAAGCRLIGNGNSQTMTLYVTVKGIIVQTYPDGTIRKHNDEHEYFYMVHP